MESNTIVKELYEELIADFQEGIGEIYPNSQGESEIYNRFLADTQNFIHDTRPVTMVFDTLINISDLHLSICQYEVTEGKEKDALVNFVQSTAYGYLYVKN